MNEVVGNGNNALMMYKENLTGTRRLLSHESAFLLSIAEAVALVEIMLQGKYITGIYTF